MHVQKSDLPNYQAAVAAYTSTVPGAPIGVEFRQQRPGIFILKTFSEKDANKVENSSGVTYYYGKSQNKQCKVRFAKLPKFKFHTNPKWITIDWVQDSGLRFATNEEFDKFMSDYGRIIEPTVDDKNELGMLNGRKKIRIDMDKNLEIERIKWVEMKVKTEEGERLAKGKLKFFYAGQPVFCRECNDDHVGKCPEKVKKEELMKEYEEKRIKNTNTLIVGDSNLRHVNEKAIFAKTNAASGAKIGHISNVLENTDLSSYTNVVINAGQNNVNTDTQVNVDKWQKQTKAEILQMQKHVTELSANGKQTRFIAVPNSPVTKSTDKAQKMTKFINNELEELSKRVNKDHPNTVKVLKIAEKLGEDIDVFEDSKHISEAQTAKMLEDIDNSLPSTEIVNHKRPGTITLTVQRYYSGVYAAYRFGCGRCTKLGHGEETCELDLTNGSDGGVATTSKHRLSSSGGDGGNKKQK